MNEIEKLRCNELKNLGMMFSFKENGFIGKEDDISDFYIPTFDVRFSDDRKWDKIIKELTTALNNRRSSKMNNEIKTHIVIDCTNLKINNNKVFVGTYQECINYIDSNEIDYKIVPMTKKELKLYNNK